MMWVVTPWVPSRMAAGSSTCKRGEDEGRAHHARANPRAIPGAKVAVGCPDDERRGFGIVAPFEVNRSGDRRTGARRMSTYRPGKSNTHCDRDQTVMARGARRRSPGIRRPDGCSHGGKLRRPVCCPAGQCFGTGAAETGQTIAPTIDDHEEPVATTQCARSSG
jgi:hypothetical protein